MFFFIIQALNFILFESLKRLEDNTCLELAE